MNMDKIILLRSMAQIDKTIVDLHVTARIEINTRVYSHTKVFKEMKRKVGNGVNIPE